MKKITLLIASICTLFLIPAAFAQTGSTFSNPLQVTSLPYVLTGETNCGFGDNYTTSDIACSGFYLNGDEKIYSFTPSANVADFNVELTNISETYSGMYITDDSTTAGNCIGDVGSSGSADRGIYGISLVGGTTYYITVSTWATPQCITSYDINMYAVSCPAPAALGVSNVTTTSADLAWTESGSATSWEVEWDTAGFTQGSGTLVFPASNPLSISNLSASTAYAYYVRSVCSAGDSSLWTGPYAFNTACTAFNMPFVEEFNSSSSSIDCWTINNNNNDGDAWSINTSSSYVHEGDQSMLIYTDGNSGNNDDYLISPQLNLTGSERLKFWYRARSVTEPNDYQVLISTTGNDPADFTDTILVDTASSLTYAEQVIDISAFTGASYIAFHIPSGGLDGWYLYVDKFTVEAIPNCLAPTALMASNIATTSVDLGWTESGSATSWVIEWDTAGFTQGSGNMVVSTSNPYALGALSANTAYEYYVRAACSATDSSTWSGPFSFSTLCSSFAVPFTEGFNSTSPTLGCWNIIDNNTDGDTWYTNTSSSYTYEGDQSMQIYTDFNSGNNDDYLISPQIVLTGSERVKFWYRARSSGEPNDYQVLISTTGINPADFTDTILVDTANSTSFAEHVIDISAFTGAAYIAFHIPNGGLDGYYFYIDAFTVDAIPTCPEPDALMAGNSSNATVDLSWTEMGAATNWEIEYDTVGFMTGTGTIVPAGSNPFTLGSLMANTSYEYYLRAVCGAGDSSIWVGPMGFTTKPDTINTFPYLNDIESGLGLYLGLRDSAESDAFVDTAAANTGSLGIYLTGNSSVNFTGGSTSATETQAFVDNSSHISAVDMVVDASALTSLTLKFDMKQTYSYGPNYSWGRVLVNGLQLGASVNPTTDLTDPFVTVAVDLSSYVGTTVNISLEHSGKYNNASGSSGKGDNAYIDNIQLYQGIVASAVLDNHATCLGGSTGGATASAVNGTAPYTFSWSNSATTASITSVVAGTYSVTIMDAVGDSSVASVTINDGAPLAISLGADTSICVGSSLTFDAGSFSSYVWDDGSTMQTRMVSYVLGATDYSLMVTDVNGCTGMDTIAVTGFAMSMVDLGNDTTVCDGAMLTLDAGSYISYVWDDASTMQTRMTTSTLGAVDYSVQITDANGCMAYDTIEVTGAAPISVDLGSDTVVCYGNDYTLDAGAGFSSYFWNNGTNMQTLTVTSTSSAALTYSVMVTDMMGCTATDEAIISTKDPVLVDLGADTNIWTPGVDTYTVDAGSGFTSYLWSDNSTTTQSYEVRRATAGLVSVIVTDNEGCEGTDTISVTFAPVSVGEFTVTTLKMYPNPAVDQITVELSNMDNAGAMNVTFLTISGQVVMTQNMTVNGNSHVESFDVSNLATGDRKSVV